MSPSCVFCGDACAGADLAPLLDSRLDWLWKQVAATADRRGDPLLSRGHLAIRAPELAEARAAAGGLLGGRVLKPGQSRRLDLAEFTLKLRLRGPNLTPGAVAAHATQKPLAARAKADAERNDKERNLLKLFADLAGSLLRQESIKLEPDQVWPVLRRSGWIARLIAAETATRLVRTAIAIVAALPREGTRLDRRRLAADTTGNAHALDDGTTLAGFVLAILAAAGAVRPRQRARAAWAEAGVDCDDLTGGLIAIGIAPVGWSVPNDAAVTLPPRVVSTCQWPPPGSNEAWVFVTENPSIASAAADLAKDCASVRLLCTSGTPSVLEIAAIARLAAAGWRIAVRADFDDAGLRHVAALLGGVAGAVPWRMGLDDYLAGLPLASGEGERLDAATLPEALWDARLVMAVAARGIAAHEEALLPALLDDLRNGKPGLTQQLRRPINGVRDPDGDNGKLENSNRPAV